MAISYSFLSVHRQPQEPPAGAAGAAGAPPLEQQGQQEPPAGAAGAAVPLCGMDFYFRVKNVEEF